MNRCPSLTHSKIIVVLIITIVVAVKFKLNTVGS